MKLGLYFVLTFWTGLAFAAPKADTVIKKDTINLRGYIYDEYGKPVKYLLIQSTQRDVRYNWYKVNCLTDTNGYFELKGAKFNDTITTSAHVVYYIPPIYNKDSRFIIVYLATRVIDLNSSRPVAISHQRLYPKITPSFKIEPYTRGGGDFLGVSVPPHIKGGVPMFEDFIKKNIVYPETAIQHNAEGTVQVEFTVEKSGQVTVGKILRGIGYGCDEEVIRVLKKSPWWLPAIDNGRPYAIKQTVSVKFSLTDN